MAANLFICEVKRQPINCHKIPKTPQIVPHKTQTAVSGWCGKLNKNEIKRTN